MGDILNNLLFDSSSDEDEGQGTVAARRRKMYRNRINFVFVTDFEVKERFRLSSSKIENLCLLLGNNLYRQNKGGSLSVRQQVCVALHWLGSGGQYHTVADMHGVSKATVCRCVKNVVEVVNRNLFHTEVVWPNNIGDVISGFYHVAGFPHVMGVVDGILIPIDAPVENEAAYVDRHGDHSLNCMFVCGPTCQVFYLSARWPGSVHDARVLRNSNLYERLEREELFHNAVLLGDSGYPLKRWLMVPCHENPEDPGEQRYNSKLKATRQTIERCLGIIKEKFPCLNYLRLEPTFAAEVVKCCTTLCNFARKGEEEEPRYEEDVAVVPDHGADHEVAIDNAHAHPPQDPNTQEGALRRNEIISLMR